MPKITKIEHRVERQRYWVYVDQAYCTSVRERTFSALGLSVGQEIACEKIVELEKNHWKIAYGAPAWEKEKVRIGKVMALIEGLDSRVTTKVVGFGADSIELIPEHPSEPGSPDLEIRTKQGDRVVVCVEVTGTESMRGTTYWVRPDKLDYARNHPELDVWLILHYAEPDEKFIFIKPDPTRKYKVSEKVVGGATELYVQFDDHSPGVVSQREFARYLGAKTTGVLSGLV